MAPEMLVEPAGEWRRGGRMWRRGHDRSRAWSYARQRLGDPAKTPEDALRAVVAVYATHPTSPLALAARTRALTPERYRRIDRDRNGVRIPAMRKTLFLVPRADAGRVFTAVRRSPAEVARSLRRHDLSHEDYERIAERVLAAAHAPMQARELEDAAGIGGQPLGTV